VKRPRSSAANVDCDEGKKGEDDPETIERRRGIIYLQTIPPLFTVRRLREELSRFGQIGRIFLQAEKRRDREGKKRKRYVEGWVEMGDKKLAKRVAASLNNTPVGGRRKSASRESLWTMKYLAGFKWIHLNEQLNYEQKIDQYRMRAEISQAKRQAEFFADQVEKGDNLRKLEEKVLKKGGQWEKYQRQMITQRKTIKESNKKKKDDNSRKKIIFKNSHLPQHQEEEMM